MISRLDYINRGQNGLRRSPVVALIGPRQCGKTTLARQVLAENSPLYFDLEDPVVAAAFENPMSSLAPLRGVVVIDEAQRCPQIFPLLRVLVDRKENPAQFLILGSASPGIVPPGLGVVGRSRGNHRNGGLSFGRACQRGVSRFVATGRLSPIFSGRLRDGQYGVEEAICSHIFGEGFGAVGIPYVASSHGAILDDDFPLPRTDLE